MKGSGDRAIVSVARAEPAVRVWNGDGKRMKLARRGIDIGFALAFTMVGAGCSDASKVHEDVGEASSPLGYAATPPPAVKRNLRLASSRGGCRPVATPKGTWTGTPIATPDGPSRSFCTYAWSSPTGASADVEALSPIAMKDGGVRPYVVNDVRATNGAPPQVALPGQNKILAPGGAGGGGGGGGTGLVFGGGGLTMQGGSAQQANGTFGLVAATDVNPEGFPGCEICGEVGEDWMFFVLPASALYAESVTLWTDDVPYDLGPVSSPVFYTPIPATYTNSFHLSW